jgi:hypothetical protein
MDGLRLHASSPIGGPYARGVTLIGMPRRPEHLEVHRHMRTRTSSCWWKAACAASQVVAVTTGPHPAAELRAAGATTVLDSLAQFPDWLQAHLHA